MSSAGATTTNYATAEDVGILGGAAQSYNANLFAGVDTAVTYDTSFDVFVVVICFGLLSLLYSSSSRTNYAYNNDL
jgi:hypothetical protein